MKLAGCKKIMLGKELKQKLSGWRWVLTSSVASLQHVAIQRLAMHSLLLLDTLWCQDGIKPYRTMCFRHHPEIPFLLLPPSAYCFGREVLQLLVILQHKSCEFQSFLLASSPCLAFCLFDSYQSTSCTSQVQISPSMNEMATSVLGRFLRSANLLQLISLV